MSEIRTVGRHTLVYAIGAIAGRLVSFIMLPVYTRLLTTADYGVLELLGTTIDLIGMIAGVGLAAGVFKRYAEEPAEQERRRLFSTVALGSGGLAFVVLLAGLVASPALTRWLLPEGTPVLYFRMFFVSYFLQSVAGVAQMYMRVRERSGLFVAVSIAKLVVSLSLAILFVVHLRLGVLGVLLGTTVTAALMFLGTSVWLFRQVGFGFARDKFVSLGRFGAPIVVWTLGSFVLTFSDRYFLEHYTGVAAVGIYSLAYRFSFLLSAFAVEPFQQVWEPRRFAVARQPDARETYRRMFLYLNLVMFAGAIAIVLVIRDGLTLLVGREFVTAYTVVPLLLAATIVQQSTGFANLGLYLKDATNLYGWSAVIAVVAALAGNALLIPRWGMMGAGVATVIAYVVRFAAVYWWSQPRYPIDYPWGRVAGLWLLFGAVWALRRVADALPLGASVVASILLGAAAAAIMYGRLLDPPAREFVGGQLRRPFAALRVRSA